MSEATATKTELNTTVRRTHASRTGPGEGRAYWFFGSLAVIRSPEGARPIVIEITVPPGETTPLHIHTRLEDSFYLLSGRLAVRSGDTTFVARAGDYVSEPAGVPQTLYALDGKPAVLLQTHAEDDFLNFIQQAGIPVVDRNQPPAGPLDFDKLFEIAAATGQNVIGPPMNLAEAEKIASAAQE